MATPSPTWPNVTPFGAPLRPAPCLISFFTSIWYLCIGFYHPMHQKIESTPEEVTMDFGHFQAFLLFLSGLRGRCAPIALLADPQT